MSDEFYWLAVVAVTIVSAARLTRLFVIDKFPPTRWLRDKYGEATDGGPVRRQWGILLFCFWCFSFWATVLVVGTGIYADVYGPGSETPEDSVRFVAWWAFNGVLAASYLASMLVAPYGDDD